MNETAQLETELTVIKSDIMKMWDSVIYKVNRTKIDFADFDFNLSDKLALAEKRINSFESKIDVKSPDALALFTPVTIDLRFMLDLLSVVADDPTHRN